MTLTCARAAGFSVLLALSFFTSYANRVGAQPIIDDKFVGGPMDQNNGYQDPSKFVIASNNAMFVIFPNGIFESVNLGLSWTALTSSSVADFCFGPDSTLYLAGANGVYSSTN